MPNYERSRTMRSPITETNVARAARSGPMAGIAGGVVLLDGEGAVLERNDEAERLLNAPKPGANFWAALADDLVGPLRSLVDAVGRRVGPTSPVAQVRVPQGWCRVQATKVVDGVVLHILDVSELVRADERARALEGEVRRRDDDLNDLLASWGMQVSFVDEELRYTKIFNTPAAYPASHYLGRRVYEFADLAAGHQVSDFQLEVLTSNRSLRREISFHDGARARTWLLYGEPMRSETGRPEGVKTVVLDVTGMREAETAASTDFLTGVANRRTMESLVQRETVRSLRYATTASVIVLDIDRFKDVNDTFGHPRGDAVLRELVGRLGENLREADVLARWGGEEFVVLLPETQLGEALRVAERMRRHVAAAPFDVVGPVTISLGVASSTAGEGGDELLARADAACLKAKRLGRDRVLASGADGNPVPGDDAG